VNLPNTLGHAARAILENDELPTTFTIPNLSGELVQRAVDGFSNFVDSRTHEDLVRWSLLVDRYPEPKEPDDGYIRKDETDRKHFFHFRSDLESQLRRVQGIRLTRGEKVWFVKGTPFLRQ
jgi:hypothetical protein